jgi:hypothetical protein
MCSVQGVMIICEYGGRDMSEMFELTGGGIGVMPDADDNEDMHVVPHHATRHLNVLISPDYLRLRHTIIDALRRHPEALKDVTGALGELESEKAQEIVKTRPLLIETSPC